jgi:hypothetical protein
MEHQQLKLARHSVVMTSAPPSCGISGVPLPCGISGVPPPYGISGVDVLHATAHWHLRRQADLCAATPSYLRHESGGDGDGVDSSCA